MLYGTDEEFSELFSEGVHPEESRMWQRVALATEALVPHDESDPMG